MAIAIITLVAQAFITWIIYEQYIDGREQEIWEKIGRRSGYLFVDTKYMEINRYEAKTETIKAEFSVDPYMLTDFPPEIAVARIQGDIVERMHEKIGEMDMIEYETQEDYQNGGLIIRAIARILHPRKEAKRTIGTEDLPQYAGRGI